MKKHIFQTIKYLLSFIVVCVCVLATYKILAWKDTTGSYTSSVTQLYNTDDNLIDVVFVGSSHCYCGINPAVLWEEKGIASFDMAVSGQDKKNAVTALKELLKSQNPSVVYVDMYALTYEGIADEGNLYRNLLPWKFSKNKISNIYENTDEDNRQNILFGFPIVHTRYKELDKYDFVTYEPNKYLRGENINFETGYGLNLESMSLDDEEEPVSDSNREWIDELFALSEEEGFELEFIVVPYTMYYGDRKILNGAKEYAKSLGIGVTDYCYLIDEIGLNVEEDFCDDTHLNASGSEKFTEYLAAENLGKYNIPDRRGNKKYFQWDEDLKYYRHRVLQNEIKDLSGYALLEKISGEEDVLTIVSYDYANNSDFDYSQALHIFKMDPKDFESGGTFIYRDNSLLKVCDNIEGKDSFTMELTKYDTLKICYYGPCNPENVKIGKEPLRNGTGNLSIICYDRVLNEIILNENF